MRVIRCTSAAIAFAALIVSVAAPAGAGSDIDVSTKEGPPGTIVLISHAFGGPPDEPCTEPIAVKAIPVGQEQGADMSGGELFTPPAGTWTVPALPPGGYSVFVVCGGVRALDYFFFTVAPTAITASPNFAG
jgi:hypothetical protein